MHKIWHDQAWEDYMYWQGEDKKTRNKINNLIKSIDRNGYECEGHPALAVRGTGARKGIPLGRRGCIGVV